MAAEQVTYGNGYAEPDEHTITAASVNAALERQRSFSEPAAISFVNRYDALAQLGVGGSIIGPFQLLDPTTGKLLLDVKAGERIDNPAR